jgi:hypothetical protein
MPSLAASTYYQPPAYFWIPQATNTPKVDLLGRILIGLYGFLLSFPRPFSIGERVQGNSLMERLAPADALLVIVLIFTVARLRTSFPPALAAWFTFTVVAGISAAVAWVENGAPIIFLIAAVLACYALFNAFGYEELRAAAGKGFIIGLILLELLVYYDSFNAITGRQILYADQVGRVRGPFYMSSQLGQFLFGSVFFTFSLSLMDMGKKWKYMAGAVALAAVPVMILTGRRSATIGCVCGLIALLVNKRWRGKIVVLLLLVAMVFVSMAIFSQTNSFTAKIYHRFTGMTPEIEAPSNKFFEEQAVSAVDAFNSAPILGVGLGAYQYKFSPSNHELHDTYLSVMAETGILGSAFFIVSFTLTIAVVVKTLFKRNSPSWTLPLAAYALASFVSAFHNVLFRDRLFWLCFALLLAHWHFGTKAPFTVRKLMLVRPPSLPNRSSNQSPPARAKA